MTVTIEATYGPSVFDCLRYSLFKLQQLGTISSYYSAFITLANRVKGFSATTLLDCFINGFKREIQCGVMPWHLETLIEAVMLAKLFIEK